MGTKRSLSHVDVMDKNFKEFEDAITSEIADTVQRLLVRLNCERNRLIDNFKEMSSTVSEAERVNVEFTFRVDAGFDQEFEKLLGHSFGQVVKSSAMVAKSDTDATDNEMLVIDETDDGFIKDTEIIRPSSLMVEDEKSVEFPISISAPTPTPMRELATPGTSTAVYGSEMYSNFKLQKDKISGKHLMEEPMEKPYGIVRMPGSNCLAFLHNENHLSVSIMSLID